MTADIGRDDINAAIETELARLVVELNLATQPEVDECVRELAGSTAADDTLAGVMVRKGFVTESQIDRAMSKISEAREGTQIPGYKILERIGSGAMATVVRARQLSLDRIVAVKVLPKRLSENAEYVERFYREGQAAAKLNHPNIVQAIDVGEAGGYHYFVMEYVEGHTLYDELAGGQALPEARALQIIIQIAKALEHAHKQGLIHRDVKPKNIMLTREGSLAKLADMGLARLAADEALAQAEAGRAFGTPYYISPEQIRGEVDIDFRADIYSLGATLYHAVTGRVPFDAPTPAAVMHKHLKEPLIPPDHVNTDLSTGVGEIVEVMMAKDRDRRYASTADLLVDLEAVASGQPPLMARKRIDVDVLSGLATQVSGVIQRAQPEPPEESGAKVSLVYLLVLLGVLAVSMILNVVLIMLFPR
jgi:serine/threonine-protein kinase